MSVLTQEYLDKSLKNLPTKQDVRDIVEEKIKHLPTKQDVEAIISEKTKNFVTKNDLNKSLANQRKELEAFTLDQTEGLARIIATTVVDPMTEGFQIIEKKLDKLASGQEEILLKLDNKADKIDLPSFPRRIAKNNI